MPDVWPHTRPQMRPCACRYTYMITGIIMDGLGRLFEVKGLLRKGPPRRARARACTSLYMHANARVHARIRETGPDGNAIQAEKGGQEGRGGHCEVRVVRRGQQAKLVLQQRIPFICSWRRHGETAPLPSPLCTGYAPVQHLATRKRALRTEVGHDDAL